MEARTGREGASTGAIRPPGHARLTFPPTSNAAGGQRHDVALYSITIHMVRMTIEMPEGVLASLHKNPAGFAQELRLAAAVKWYEMQKVSQARAAEIAGLSRAEFIEALSRFGVTPFQYDADEIASDAERG
jgi:predicted HTH domain antitoxin